MRSLTFSSSVSAYTSSCTVLFSSSSEYALSSLARAAKRASVTGDDTLRYLENDSFDVILSDIRMPEIDGPALYKILGERWPELIPVLAFITGDTLSSRVKEFLERSGRPFVEKPITPAEVRDLVARVAKGH